MSTLSKEAAEKQAAEIMTAKRAAWTLGFATHFCTEVPHRPKAAPAVVKWASSTRQRYLTKVAAAKQTILASLVKSADTAAGTPAA
jgi:hypothetical protein